MIKGIIFDADGTLLDSMRIWAELGERYLTGLGIKAEEGLSDILYPMTLEESSNYIKERYHLADTVEKITEDTLKLIEHFYQHEVKTKAGLDLFLEKLRQKQVSMGIATSGDKEILRSALIRLGIDQYFAFILTCTELGTSKQEAVIYQKAAQMLGTEPEETVVFEDVLHGIKTAKSSGFITVAIEDASNQRDREEIARTADYYIEDFQDPVLQTIL